MANSRESVCVNGAQKLRFSINKNFLNFVFFFAILLGSFLFFGIEKASAATGDITAVRISSDTAYSGWVAEVDISGLSTGGTYDFGLGANNDPTNAKVVFTVTSQGYDDSGNATTMARTVYGTNYVRKVYPNNAQAYETDNGGSVTVRVALSDYIYSSDTVTITVGSAFYTQGSGNNTVSSLSVTNNSAEAYPKVIANWSWPGYDRITGSTFKLRAVAFHRSAQQGRPVKAVKYTCTDQHSNTVTTTVTSPSIDGTISDAVPVVEYVGTLSATTLTQGDTLTCNFIAYPWYGDSNSVLNTGDGINTMPTPLYAPQYYLVDTGNTYGVTVAVVDSVAGNNGTGVAVDYASFDSQNPPAAFLNIYAAANAIAAYNNTNHSRNNTGAGIIYLKEGSHVWTGGTVTAGGQASAPSWVTVTKFPGTTRANVLISSVANTKQIGERLKIEDVKITNSTTIGFTGMDAVWVHNSDMAPTGAATFYINTVNYFTNSQFYNSAELVTYSTVNSSRALVRGNTSAVTLSAGGVKAAYTVIGNDFDFSAGSPISADYPGQTTPAVSNAIYAFNILSQSSATSPIIGHLNSSIANATGTAIVQNILERVSGTAPPIMQIAADQSTSNPVNNILIWNNTLVGQRLNMAYNDYNLNDIGPVYRRSWSVKNNIFDDYNSITDIDAHGGTPNASRYGNHSTTHGVGLSGNVDLERTGASGYYPKFIGLSSVLGSSMNPYYVDDNSAVGDGTGNGDYHLTASSPALNLTSSGQALLIYDIAGSLRHSNGFGAAGAYEWDVTAPTVTAFTIPSIASSLTVSISTFTATDAVGVTGYKLTESSSAPAYDASGWSGSSPTTYTFASAGSKTLYAWAKDAVGNVSTSASDTTTITLDSTAPTTTASPLGGYYNSAQSVTLTCADNVGGTGCDKTYYTTNGAVPTTGSTQYTTTPISIISTTVLKFFSTDLAGNSETYQTQTYTFDTTGPTGTISNGNGSPTNSTTPTFNLTIADAGIGITGAQMQFSCNNSTWSSWESYATPKTNFNIRTGAGCTDADGSKTIYVEYKDSLGNIGSSYNTGVFTLDTSASFATLSGTPASITRSTSASITVAGTNIVSYEYKLDSGSYGSETVIATAISLSGLADGSHTLSVIGKNSAGTWQVQGSATTYTWTVDTTAPVVTFSIPATSNSLTVTFTSFSATDTNGVTGYLVNESATTPAIDDAGWAGTAQTQYVFATEGTKTLYAWAKDGVGNISTAGAGSVTVTLPILTHTITASSGANGSITPSGATTVNNGDSQSFTITADSGYYISDVLVDSSSVGAATSYDFTGVDADHTISAIFEADTNADENTDSNTDTQEKAKLDVWSAKLFTDKSSCPEKLKLTIKGHHFENNTQVKIGNDQADSTDQQSSAKLTATFCLEKLLNTKTNHKRTVSVQNPGRDNDKADKKIDLDQYLVTPETAKSNNSSDKSASMVTQDEAVPRLYSEGNNNIKPNVCSYTVASGDTLWRIAQQVYGDTTAYPLIIDKNKDKYPDIKSKLLIGQELTFCDNNQTLQSTGNNSNTDNSLPTLPTGRQAGQAGSQQNQTQPQPEPQSSPPAGGFRWWNPFTWF